MIAHPAWLACQPPIIAISFTGSQFRGLGRPWLSASESRRLVPRPGAACASGVAVRSWRDGDMDDRRIRPVTPATAGPVRPAISGTLARDRPPRTGETRPRPASVWLAQRWPGTPHRPTPGTVARPFERPGSGGETLPLALYIDPPKGATPCRIVSDSADRRARRRAFLAGLDVTPWRLHGPR